MVWCSKQSIKQISIKNQVGTNNRYQKKNRKQRDKKMGLIMAVKCKHEGKKTVTLTVLPHTVVDKK